MSLSIQVDTTHDCDGDMNSGGKSAAGRWTQEEHNMFLQGLQTHQKQWKLIAEMVKTRTVVQIRTHAQKYFQKLHKTNGGWTKYDKMDDPNSPFSEHEGQRNFAYPVADSRANSFCSSGDSVDSNGTSAEGVDSEGEVIIAQRPPLQAASKPRTGTLQSGVYSYEFNASSGATSTTNSTLSSPTGPGHNAFIAAQMQLQQQQQQQIKRPPALNVLKVKGELVRKRSRDSIKSMLPGDGKATAPSPKKGSYTDTHFVSSLKARADPDVHPSRAHSAGSPSVSFRANMFGSTAMGHHESYSGHMPGPLGGLPDDLGAGLGLGLDLGSHDFYFPSGTFPDDPTCGFNSHLACGSTDTDLTNPSAHYHSHQGHGSGGCGLIDHDAHGFDDADLMNILGTIDWNEPVPGNEDSVSSTCTNSRPLSPATDSASTVSTMPNCTAARTLATTTAPGKNPSPVPSAAHAPLGVAECASTDLIDDAPVPKKHRVAFSNVIEELQLVSQAVRDNSSAGGTGGQIDADHISLFDLFQRDGTQTIGRLPPLRALVQQARERSNVHRMGSGESVHASTVAYVESAAMNTSGVNFDDHDFDFCNFMDDDAHPMDCVGCAMPLHDHHQQQQTLQHAEGGDSSVTANTAASLREGSVRSGSTGDLFAHGTSIMDASGAINPTGALLTINMLPNTHVGSAPSSATNTPGMIQRKRGRPRKHSISGPSVPTGTPGAATAKSLLPALTHSINGTQFQGHSLPEGQGYLVPVNPAVAQAYNFAVAAAGATSSTASDYAAYNPQNARSLSGDRVSSGTATLTALRLSLHSNNNNSNNNQCSASDYPQMAYGSGNYFGADIRLGLTRTMSSESDNMMAAVFDPKLYDHSELGLGMLEDFE